MFRNAKVGTILSGLNALSLAMAALLAICAIYISYSLSGIAAYAFDNTIPSIEKLGEINASAQELASDMGSHVLAPTTAQTLVIDGTIDPALDRIASDIAGYAPLVSDDKEQAIYADVVSKWQHVKTTLPQLRQESIAVHTDVATQLFNSSFKPAIVDLEKAIQADIAYNQKLASDARSHSELASRLSMVFGLVVGLCAIAAALASMLASKRRVIKPLDRLTRALDAITGGDLAVEVAGTDLPDEFGMLARSVEEFRVATVAKQVDEADLTLVVSELAGGLSALAEGDVTRRIGAPFAARYEKLRTDYNAAAKELADILTQVTKSAQGVRIGAAEISNASRDLAQRTEEQAASLEETVAAMNQVTDIVRETAENTGTVRVSVSEAHADADTGGVIVRRAVQAMDGIEKSAQEIAQITNVIDGIAFQTSLLALNAGVEAARAGDAGQGFAVVAIEVRALAQRSADAAKQIKTLIATSTEQVTEGVDLVGKTGKTLGEIVERVAEVSSMISHISESAQSQSANLQQVNSAMGSMDQMTQQNAAMVEQSAAAARSLAAEADQLITLVGRFRTEAPADSSHGDARRQAGSPALATRGNLALKLDAATDDWAEF
jgi:methyl-accepting chemotaxis protein